MPYGDETQALQQIMETMRTLQQANEEYCREQDRLREKARAE